MIFKTGAIFLADIPENNELRPVVILENLVDNKVEIVPISSNTKNSNKNRIAVNLLLSDKISYVSLLPDRVTIIPNSYLKTQIGSVNSGIVNMLVSMIATQKSLKESYPEESSEPIIFQKYIDSMRPYIVDTNDILKRMVSKRALLANIFIAIATGVIASLITNLIWQVIGLKN